MLQTADNCIQAMLKCFTKLLDHQQLAHYCSALQEEGINIKCNINLDQQVSILQICR